MFHYGFCDLNININGLDKKGIISVCKQLRNKGFRTIALNQTIDEDSFKTKKKKGKNEDSGPGIIPEPVVIDTVEGIEDLKILNRLTVHLSDPSKFYQLKQSLNFIKYHLFAVVPLNQTILQQVCGSNDPDIISFLPESKPPYRLSRKLYNMAVEKNIFFEIPYGPAILDTTCRKHVISCSHHYFTIGKSKNVIISSCSSYPFFSIRGPYDVVHLGLLFGLNDVKTKEAISANCTKLIFRAETRRRRKSCISTISIIPSSEETTKTDEEPFNLHPTKKLKLSEKEAPINVKA